MAVKKVLGVIRDLARDFVRTGTRTNDLPNGISLTTIRNEDEAVSVQPGATPKWRTPDAWWSMAMLRYSTWRVVTGLSQG